MPNTKSIISELNWLGVAGAVSFLAIVALFNFSFSNNELYINFHDTHVILNLFSTVFVVTIAIHSQVAFIRSVFQTLNPYPFVSAIIAIGISIIALNYVMREYAFVFYSDSQIATKQGWTIYPPLSAVPEEMPTKNDSIINVNNYGVWIARIQNILVIQLILLSLIKLKRRTTRA